MNDAPFCFHMFLGGFVLGAFFTFGLIWYKARNRNGDGDA